MTPTELTDWAFAGLLVIASAALAAIGVVGAIVAVRRMWSQRQLGFHDDVEHWETEIARAEKEEGSVRAHEWQEISFSWGGFIECSCGYRPRSQAQMDAHVAAPVGERAQR